MGWERLLADGLVNAPGVEGDEVGGTPRFEPVGVDVVAEQLEAVVFERLDHEESSDELAEDDDASQGFVLAELSA